jgi:predicted DNA-binding protein (MmcQ/YjbR family)
VAPAERRAAADHVGQRLRLKLREYALTLPGAWEDHPWDEVVAKVAKKVFVFFGAEESPGMSVKLVDPIQRDHALSLPGAKPTGYGLGRSGWVSIPFGGKTPQGLLAEFIEESYRAIAPKTQVAKLDAGAGKKGKQ